MVNAYGASEVKTWLMGVLFSILLLPASVYAQTQRTVTMERRNMIVKWLLLTSV